jgi:hypothetical protein
MAPPPPPEPPPLDPPELEPLPLPDAPAVAGAMVTCAVPVRVESAEETALMVTVAGEGTVAGAMYMPIAEIVPTVEFPPLTPLTRQVTAVFVEFATVAVKACEPVPAVTVDVPGATETDIAGTMVTCAEPDLFMSAAATAVTVTVAGDGRVVGAVYTPEVEIMPTVELPPVTPLTCQVTAVLVVFVTVAVNV